MPQQVQGMCRAGLPISRQAKQNGAPQQYRISAKCQGTRDIRAMADTAIKQDSGMPADLGSNGRQRGDGRRCTIQIPRTVIGHHHAISAGLNGAARIIGA